MEPAPPPQQQAPAQAAPAAVEPQQAPPSSPPPSAVNKKLIGLMTASLLVIIGIGVTVYVMAVQNSPANVLKRAAFNSLSTNGKQSYKADVSLESAAIKQSTAAAMFGISSLTGSASFRASQDLTDKKDPKGLAFIESVKLKLSNTLEFSLYPELEVRYFADKYYVNLGKADMGFMVDLSKAANQWFEFEQKKTDSAQPVVSLSAEEDRQLVKDFFETDRAVAGIKQEKDQEIEGEKTRRYRVAFSQEGLNSWYERFQKALIKNGMPQDRAASDSAFFKKLEFHPLDIWVSPQDTVKQIKGSITYKDPDLALKASFTAVFLPFTGTIERPANAKKVKNAADMLYPPLPSPTSSPLPRNSLPSDPNTATDSGTTDPCGYVREGLGKYYTTEQYSQCLQQNVLGVSINYLNRAL